MKLGKLPEAVENRSVVRILNAKGKEPANVAACEIQTATEQQNRTAGAEIVLEYPEQVRFLTHRVSALLTAQGAAPLTAQVCLLLPDRQEESELKVLIREIRDAAEECGVRRVQVCTRVSSCVTKPVMSLTAQGTAQASFREKLQNLAQKVKQGPESFDIVMVGYAAMEATVLMHSAKKEELQKKLASQYMEEALPKLKDTDLSGAAELAVTAGAYFKPLGDGGVFAGLWELAEEYGCGLEVQIKEIPLFQETIEICEVLDLNPYQMMSQGAALVVAEESSKLLLSYAEAKILAKVIGTFIPGHDRVLINEEERRFLEPFREDELYRAGILH